jgi:hypothetical protein
MDSQLLGDRLRRKSMMEINEALRASILEPVLKELAENGELEMMAEKLIQKKSDPYSLAEEIAGRYLKNVP